MSYVVLARKWRPMSFADLVGQDHVAKTLGNAIKVGRVAHAFLFTGVRGVGKTTSARILAKALNCMGDPELPRPEADPGPTVEPCLKCPACLEIAQGRDVDVQEIDGASYNGVDEVRKLQDSLPYRPARDRFKIVIVDEVHMLTNSAWNAFLKTLEEPPPHVKFIFATTEVHKLPITILSRVQRFDFKMIPAKTIASRIRYVLAQEEITADDTAISLIARQAAGSMRDAMSLLDQVIAFAGQELIGEEVALALGAASRSRLTELAEALVTGQPDRCVTLVSELADQGFDIPNVTKELLALLRDLVVAKIVKNPRELLDLADEEVAAVTRLAEIASETDLLRLHQGFSKSFDEVVRTSDPRAALEMLLVRLSLRPALLSVDELLHRISHLEKRLFDPNAPARPAPQRQAPAPAPVRPQARETRTAEAARPPADPKADDEPPSPSPPPKAIELASKPPSPAPSASSAPREPTAPRVAPATDPAPRPKPIEDAPKATSSLPEQGPTTHRAISPERLAILDRALPFFDRLREVEPELSAYLEQTIPLSVTPELFELGIEAGYIFEKQIETDAAKECMRRLTIEVFGANCQVRLTKSAPGIESHESIAAERLRRKRARHEEAIQAVKAHPKIQAAVQIFGGEIRSVTVPEV